MSEDINKNKENIAELDKRMSSHEAMCEERWKTNFNRLDDIDFALRRIEARTMAVGGGLILFLAGLIVTLLTGN